MRRRRRGAASALVRPPSSAGPHSQFLLFYRVPNRFELREEIGRDKSIDAGWRDVPGHSATLVRDGLRERYDLIRIEAGRLLAPRGAEKTQHLELGLAHPPPAAHDFAGVIDFPRG